MSFKRPQSTVGREVRSKSGAATGIVREDESWPLVSVEWSDGWTTTSDGRLFPELREVDAAETSDA